MNYFQILTIKAKVKFLFSNLEVGISLPFISYIVFLLVPNILQLINGIHLVRNIFSLLIYAFILCIPLFFRIRFWLYVILSLPLLLLTVAQVYYNFVYGEDLISWSALASALDTNITEIFEYLIESNLRLSLSILIILLVILLIILQNYLKVIILKIKCFYLLAIGVLIILDYALIGPSRYVFPSKIISSYKIYNFHKKAYYQSIDRKKTFFFNGQRSITETEKELYVLIIGESMTRNHMGVYDYCRNTTPNLDTLRNAVWFDNAISPGENTIISLSSILNNCSVKDIENASTKKTFISLFKEVGFKTYWISNQGGDGLINALASEADSSIFLDLYQLAGHYDGDLMNKIDIVLNKNDEKRFIVLHLLGSHSLFSQRYPIEYNCYDIDTKDKKQNVLNAYDNSIIYSDFIISEILRKVKSQTSISWVVYFSDHGEMPDDHANGHPSYIRKSQFDIPLFFWYSDLYEGRFPLRIVSLKCNKNKKYSTEYLFHTICGLSYIDNIYYRRNYDLSDSTYNLQDERLIKRINHEILEYDKVPD